MLKEKDTQKKYSFPTLGILLMAGESVKKETDRMWVNKGVFCYFKPEHHPFNINMLKSRIVSSHFLHLVSILYPENTLFTYMYTYR